MNAVWDAQPAPGDHLVVVGEWWTLVAWLCRQMPGTDVTVVDPNPAREEAARELNLSFRTEPPRGSTADSGRPRQRESGWPDDRARACGCRSAIVDVSWYGARASPPAVGRSVPFAPPERSRE